MMRLVHPVFVAYTGGLFALGAAAGYRPGALSVAMLAWGLWWAFGASALGILINDYFDRHLDVRNPRKQAFETVYDPRHARRYSMLVSLAVLSAGALLAIYPSDTLAWCLAAFAAGTLAYNAPPVRLKERAGFDVLVGPASFVPPLAAGWSLAAGAPPVLVVVAVCCATAGLELFHKTFDIEADRAEGLRTAVVALGLYWSLALCALLESAAAATLALWAHQPLLFLIALPYLGMLAGAAAWPEESSRRRLFGHMRGWHVYLGVVWTCLIVFLKLQ